MKPINLTDAEVQKLKRGELTEIVRKVKTPSDDGWVKAGRCPYAKPNETRWVREAWQAWRYCSVEYDEWDLCNCAPSEIHDKYGNPKLEYRADGNSVGPWRSSIQMPLWASRFKLNITEVTAEKREEWVWVMKVEEDKRR